MINTHDAIRAHMEGRLHKQENPAPEITPHKQGSDGYRLLFNKEDGLLAKTLGFVLRDPVCRLHLAIASVKRANVVSNVEPTKKRRGRPPGRKSK